MKPLTILLMLAALAGCGADGEPIPPSAAAGEAIGPAATRLG